MTRRWLSSESLSKGVTRACVLPSSILVAFALAVASASPAATRIERVSTFGSYSGYSDAAYDGWQRHSVYAPAGDGTRIALDYFLPTDQGVEASGPLPTILMYTRYIRAWENGGTVSGWLTRGETLQRLLRHGYAVVIADARGTGASFGVHNLAFSAEETADSYEIVEWIAGQSWCDGHVGMYGRSYMGTTAYLATTQAPPHLDAVFAEMAGTAYFDFVHGGGVYKSDFIGVWGPKTRAMDKGQDRTPARVDEDTDGSLRRAAIAGHARNLWVHKFAPKGKLRDWSMRRRGATWSWDMISALARTAEINASGIPVYHLAGWLDMYPTQQALLYANLTVPQRIAIGPWSHEGGLTDQLQAIEAHRWFDHWLKGVDNGVAREKPVRYFVMRGNNTVPADPGRLTSQDDIDAEDGRRWHATKQWPPRATRKSYYLAAGPSGTVSSTNDGLLVTRRPRDVAGRDDYRVDYTSSTGSFNRWVAGYTSDRDDLPGTSFFDERTPEDRKALTYTSAPMTKDLVIVGHPIVHLWVTSTHRDGDLFVYLEEVDSEGTAHYVTERALRASYRATGDAPWDSLGLPFHPSLRRNLADLPNEPAELVLDLIATAIVIDRGHRIRVTIAGADAANYASYPDVRGRDAPRISIHRNAAHLSRVELPVAAR